MLTVNRLDRKNKNRLMSRAGIWVQMLLPALCALVVTTGARAQEVQLQDTTFVALPGHKLEVRLDFDQPPPSPKAYMIDSPPRLVMDFWGVSNELGSRQIDIRTGQLDSLNFAQAEGRLRVVGNLNEPVSYRTFTENNSLFIELAGAGESTAANTTVESASAQSPQPARAADAGG